MKILLEIHDVEEFESDYLEMIIERGKIIFEEVNDVVADIIDKVIEKGDEALIECAEQYDCVKLSKDDLAVTKEEIEEAYDLVDEAYLKALRQAKKNIKKFHEAQSRDNWSIETEPGVEVGQIVRPLKRVGLYIPGCRAPYPSTVLMTALPARAAGVGEIFLVTPPNKEGNIDKNGRRKPVVVPGSEYFVSLDTLIVSIGDEPDTDFISSMGIDTNKNGLLIIDKQTLATSRKGVFAG